MIDFSNFKGDKLVSYCLDKISRINNCWEKEIYRFIISLENQSSFTFKTSGSTGLAKEIIFTKNQIAISARLTSKFFQLSREYIFHNCLPIEYVASKMLIARAYFNNAVLTWEKPSSTPDLFGEIDFISLTPHQVSSLISNRNIERLNKIKIVLIGGAPLLEKSRNELINKKINAFESYGMTETLTHIALKHIQEDHFKCLESINVSKDEQNCLLIKYPKLNIQQLKTNDIVEIIDDFSFKWIGRIDNVINTGGIKINLDYLSKKFEEFINLPFFLWKKKSDKYGEKLILVLESNELPKNIIKDISLLVGYEKPKEIYINNNFQRTNLKIMKDNTLQKATLVYPL